MKKMYFTYAVLFLLSLFNVQLIYAASASSAVKTKAEISKSVNAGNTICPVTGQKIEEKTKATYEYNGKEYNFCCSMCIDKFKSDPQKYIDKIEKTK